MKERPCPCNGCMDRNAHCHSKGNCPHDFEGWEENHKLCKEEIEKNKRSDVPKYTAAQEKRHFNYIKYGPMNTKK